MGLGARVLTVRLPQAATARVRMVSELSSLGLMGMLRWCEQELAGDDLDRVIGAMKDNRCWLTTPWHDLELVHAVQHPLEVPQWGAFEAFRSSGQTYADVAGTYVHRRRVHREGRPRRDLDRARRRPSRGRPAGAVRPHDRLQPADGRIGARPGRTARGYRLRDGKELTFDSRMAQRAGAPAADAAPVRRHQVPPGQLRGDGDHAVP